MGYVLIKRENLEVGDSIRVGEKGNAIYADVVEISPHGIGLNFFSVNGVQKVDHYLKHAGDESIWLHVRPHKEPILEAPKPAKKWWQWKRS